MASSSRMAWPHHTLFPCSEVKGEASQAQHGEALSVALPSAVRLCVGTCTGRVYRAVLSLCGIQICTSNAL